MNKKKRAQGIKKYAQKGGKRTFEKYGRDHFVEMGRKGGAKVQEYVRLGKKQLEEEETRVKKESPLPKIAIHIERKKMDKIKEKEEKRPDTHKAHKSP
ncbi:MAG: hypothetical protein M1355_02810 [Patescibacteria group bacterium]|nr:hypothetical protein [Patescibacteria group bacterium]MCL5094035.1 hypothetical protein [Patescibacteria group bacterium]